MTAAVVHDREPDGGEASQGPRPAFALRALFVAVVLYAAFGKGFAYAGWPPLYIGELLLVVVLFAALRPWTALPRNAPALVTAGLVMLAIVQFAVDRLVGDVVLLESARGLAPIYYSAYAFGGYALLREHERRMGRDNLIEAIVRGLVRAVPLVSTVVLALAVLLVVEPGSLPRWPGSGVSMLLTKSGDIAVTLVLLLPLLRSNRLVERIASPRLLLLTMWFTTALAITFRSRGALLALLVGLVVSRPNPARVAKGVVGAAGVLVVLYVSGLSIGVGNRQISYDAAGDAVASLLGTAPEDEIGGNYLGTRNWRTDWWSDIWADVTDDRMVLHGYGWGDNLAVRHGIVPRGLEDDPRVLRLPHSLFFSLAGRAGVVFAVGFVLVPLMTIARTFRHPSGSATAPIVDGARGAIAAALVTASFGVFIESPQGGILMWCLVGFLWWATARPIDDLSARSEI